LGKVLKPNTEKILRDRYYLRDPQRNLLETEFSQPCQRIADYVALAHLQTFCDPRKPDAVAQVLASNEKEVKKKLAELKQLAAEFFTMHYDQFFAANSPTWFNAGNPYCKKMLSACFILHVPNSIEGIYKAVQDGAIIGKFGGGIGMDGSQISPYGASTNSGGIASGVLSFMSPFQDMAGTVVQGGRRRIAEMFMLAVWHPEILAFIDCKKKTGPERLQWLMDTHGVDLQTARAIAKGFNWLTVKNEGTDHEQDDWITPFCFMNISVKISREFMEAVNKDSLFMLRRAIVEDEERGPRARKIRYEPWTGPVNDPRGENGEMIVEKDGIKYIRARKLWYERLMPAAHASAEPGIFFEDAVNDDNPVKSLGPIHNSNPCGEYAQVDYNSCNLGSINLLKFFEKDVRHPVSDWVRHIDWKRLGTMARLGTRFLDYVITMNEYPIPEITKTTNASRPVGLGVMGWADLLLMLEVAYGSDISYKIAEALQEWINYHAWIESTELAADFGEFPELKNNREYFDAKMERLTNSIKTHPAFPKPDISNYSPVPNLLTAYKKNGVRNCHVTVIAPTGTIANIDQCSYSVEPHTFFVYKRQDTVGVRYYYSDIAYAKLIEIHEQELPAALKPLVTSVNYDDQYQVARWLFDNYGDKLPAYFVDANKVTPEQHVRMQAAFQKHCDNAISKTCNMPETSTVADVAQIYDLAYQLNLKGCTVYREGSRHGVIVRDKRAEPKKDNKGQILPPEPKPVIKGGQLEVLPRPAFLDGGTYVVPDGHDGKLYVTANFHEDDGRIIEVFLRENAGNEWTELAGRLVSLLLRSNVPMKEIRQQLRRVGGQSAIWYNGKYFSSSVQLLDEVLFEQAAKYFANKVSGLTLKQNLPTPEEEKDLEPLARGPKCPDCSEKLQSAGGCFTCPNPECGYSKCK
jgi:ribonucleoside-diphosphate reductase alpha chain